MASSELKFEVTIDITADQITKYKLPKYEFKPGPFKVSIAVSEIGKTFYGRIYPDEAKGLYRSPELMDLIFQQIPQQHWRSIIKALIHEATPISLDLDDLKDLTIYRLFKIFSVPSRQEEFLKSIETKKSFSYDLVVEYWDSIEDFLVPKEIWDDINLLKGLLYISNLMDSADDYANKYERR